MTTAGQKLGGIHSLDDLMARCDVNELTDCWIWRESLYPCGRPRITATVNGVRMTSRGRRIGLLLAGNDGPKGWLAIPRMECKCDRCVNPEHSKWATVRKSWDRLVESGDLKNLATRTGLADRINETRRKVTPEMIAEIRSSDEKGAEIARKLGLSTNTVCRIRTYKTHVDKGFSVFKWRP